MSSSEQQEERYTLLHILFSLVGEEGYLTERDACECEMMTKGTLCRICDARETYEQYCTQYGYFGYGEQSPS